MCKGKIPDVPRFLKELIAEEAGGDPAALRINILRYFRALTPSKCVTVLNLSLSPNAGTFFAPPKGPTLNPFF
jgi:hypothetical protein